MSPPRAERHRTASELGQAGLRALAFPQLRPCPSRPTRHPATSRWYNRSRSGPAISANWWKFSKAGSRDRSRGAAASPSRYIGDERIALEGELTPGQRGGREGLGVLRPNGTRRARDAIR